MAHQLHHDSEDVIYEMAYACEDLLVEIVSKRSHSLLTDLLETYQARFSTWAAYLGVFARPSQRLDRRLQHLPDLQDIIFRLLDSLGRCLTSSQLTLSLRVDVGLIRVIAVKQRGPDFMPDHCKESHVFLQSDKDLLAEVDEIITQLNRLGLVIRNSAQSSVDNKVNDFAEKAELEPLRDLFESMIQILFPLAPQPLRHLLSASMFTRYAKIRFVKARESNLSTRHDRYQSQLSTIGENLQSSDQIPQPDQRVRSSSALPYRSDQASNPSLEPLSSIDPHALRAKIHGEVERGPKTYRTSTVLVNQSRYPQGPKGKVDGSTMCFICARPLNEQDLEPNNWSQHIDNDIKPYICLIDECKQSDGFANFQDWTSHMRDHSPTWHRKIYQPLTWQCPFCAEDEGYTGSHSLREHLTVEHSNILEGHNPDIISEQSRMLKLRPRDECLLCGFRAQECMLETTVPSKRENQTPEDMNNERIKPDGPETAGHPYGSSLDAQSNPDPDINLARHIASHLQTLMFLVLRIVSIKESYDQGQDEFSVGSDLTDVGEVSIPIQGLGETSLDAISQTDHQQEYGGKASTIDGRSSRYANTTKPNQENAAKDHTKNSEAESHTSEKGPIYDVSDQYVDVSSLSQDKGLADMSPEPSRIQNWLEGLSESEPQAANDAPTAKGVPCFLCQLKDPVNFHSGRNFKRWSDILIHINRTHLLKNEHCALCRIEFKGQQAQEMKNEHLRNASCQPASIIEKGKMLPSEYEKLKGLPGSLEEKWFGACGLLFPRQVLPTSPWYQYFTQTQ
ncbi:serine/threonine protein kinase [Fusarium austroafricanum]|uniref:Serine/threonine protein kinase n=1 Tax=Fusarium austroafricanum TaxID=2364996 RepID=A0A8H4NW24_9HYPO|nr:serine/threonine protein kinase [Fusarium austroafricanum]